MLKKILTFFILGYVLRLGYNWITIQMRRRTKDVHLAFDLFREELLDFPCAMVFAPFYDEEYRVRWSIGLRGPRPEYTPLETGPDVISRFFAARYLVQIGVDYSGQQEFEDLHEMGLDSYGREVRFETCARVYSPEALGSGHLISGMTAGTDAYLICPDPSRIRVELLAGMNGPLQENGYAGAFIYARANLGAEALLIKENEYWILYHEDEVTCRRFVDAFLDAAHQKLFTLNQLARPESQRSTTAAEICKTMDQKGDKPIELKLYFEDDRVVTFWERGRRYHTRLDDLPPGLLAREEGIGGALGYLLPELISDRAYTRKSLIRFSIQYFMTTVYLFGGAVGLAFFVENVLGWDSVVVRLFAVFVGGFLAVLTLILSVWYLLTALFGRRRLIRPGI